MYRRRIGWIGWGQRQTCALCVTLDVQDERTKTSRCECYAAAAAAAVCKGASVDMRLDGCVLFDRIEDAGEQNVLYTRKRDDDQWKERSTEMLRCMYVV